MAIRHFIFFSWVLCIQGCVHGVLYTHTTKPLSINYQSTNTASSLHRATGDTKHIDLQLQAKWDADSIGYIAQKNGLTNIFYADVETLSILFGIWEQEYVHIYGE